MQPKPKKSITDAISELDQEMHVFMSARLEINDFDEFQNMIDKYLALTTIMIQLAADQGAGIIDTSGIS